MTFSPTTTVYLLDTPLDNKYKNQILFTSSTYQWDYFRAQTKHEFHNCTYQRKNSSIRVHANIETLWDSNYVMYQNANFGTKWFYAFVTKMDYISEEVTEIFIETDVFQTWRSETALMRSFVVREHVDDDTIGLHLIDEQLEIGEYKMDNYGAVDKMGGSYNILAVSDTSPMGVSETVGNIYGNTVSGLMYFPFPNDEIGMTWLKTAIQAYSEKPDAIAMIFTVPKLLVPIVDSPDYLINDPIPSGDIWHFDYFDTTKQLTDIDGYTPKNGKLHTFPFKFLYMSNNTGQSATYRYEDFALDYMRFMISGAVMPNPSIFCIPQDYRGGSVNYEYALTLSGFPLGSWTSDAYTAWFAQNGASVGIALAGSALAIIGGGLTGNPLAVAGGVLGVASEMAQVNKAMIQPDQAKGQTGSGSLHFGTNTLDFYYSHMTIKKQYAKMVDDFLSMFGYKVNALKVPETRSRMYWNYIKTIDVNIDGAIPDEDMGRLKQMYNDGVTLWHDPTKFLRYDLNNSIGDLGSNVPTLVSAVSNIGGSIISLTFSETMSNPSGKLSEFSVTVGGINRAITSIALNGTVKYDIVLSSSVVFGDVITVNYTKGTILSVDRGILSSFNHSVVNSVVDLSPNLLSAVTSIDGNKITLSFNKSMNPPNGKQAEFNLTVNGTNVSVLSCVLDTDNKKIDLTVGTAITTGQTVKCTYTKGSVTSTDGGQLGSFNLYAVTNNVPSLYQKWGSGYPDSIILSSSFPYQMISTRDTGEGYVYLFYSASKLYVSHEGGAQYYIHSATTVYGRYYTGGVWYATAYDVGGYPVLIHQANNNIYTDSTLANVHFAKTT